MLESDLLKFCIYSDSVNQKNDLEKENKKLNNRLKRLLIQRKQLKKEIKNLKNDCEDLFQQKQSMFENMLMNQERALNEIKRSAGLQQRIDKAIEYINNSQRWLCKIDNEYCETIKRKDLLEILGVKK